MKSSIYSMLAAVSLSFMSTAQNASAVTKMPGDANGYLILNKGFYSDVSSWRIVVKEKIWNATTSTYTYTTKLDQTLSGKNYLKIPTAYRNASHVMDITGYSGTTTVVEVNEYIIGDPVETICAWICNGSNYAYSLQMNDIPFVGVKISMQDAPPPVDAPYYYQWIEASNWNNFRSLNPSGNYGYSSWTWAEEHAGDGIIQINVPSGQYKYDQFGTPMNGAVIGLSKYYGPYTPVHQSIVSDPLVASESDCGFDIQWAIDAVNAGEETPVQIVCSGTSSNTHAEEAPYADVMDPEAGENDPCFEDYYDYIGWHAGSGTGVYQVVQIPCNWLVTSPDQGTGTGIHWPANVSRITMKSMYSSIDPVNIVLRNEDLFDENGDFAGPNYNIPAGFYNILYQYDDLSIGSYFVEVPTTTGSAVIEKDFLSYTTYPVPVQDDRFFIDFSASKKVVFTYELRDAANNLLFTEEYTVEKDSQSTVSIEPANGIPNGMLYSKLIFSDNSIINFTIVK